MTSNLRRTSRRISTTLLVIYLSIICHWSTAVDAFNVEWERSVQFREPRPNSLFGFSIALHRENNRSWVVIGAPEAEDMQISYNYKGGAVYYCDSSRNDACSVVSFAYDQSGTAAASGNRTKQWLGATVRSSGVDGTILVCAPRYYWFRTKANDNSVRDPIGTCFTVKNEFRSTQEYSLCRTVNSQGHVKQGSCELGLGAAISKDSNRLFLGAVGSYYWQGQVFSIHTILKLPFTFDEKEVLFNEETGQLISQSVFNRPDMMATKEAPSSEDDSYMGYSVETISYYDTGITGAVVGVPRGHGLNGKISFMTWNLTSIKNITGDQFGAYFGYSLAVVDVNGDGADDVIVGAPMYSDYSSNKNEYETGRVYIFYQNPKGCSTTDARCWSEKFDASKFTAIDGESSTSRFGLSIASLGDINKDGYGDFAVGAPYLGSLKDCMKSTVTGAVYIFHGSKDGVKKKYSQKIQAEDLSKQSQGPLTTFGFSLSGGVDLDGNSYPDLAVGAYESGVVYLFKSRPVIYLESSLKFLSNNTIELNRYKNCETSNREKANCIDLRICFHYIKGEGAEDNIEIQVEVKLDAKKKNSRMFFMHNEGNRKHVERFRLQKGASKLCRDMKTYIPSLKPYEDKLTPVVAEMEYNLFVPPLSYHELQPILNMDDETALTRKDAIYFKNNCGEDNICEPELHMAVHPNVEQFVLGSGSLIFNVSVVNRGEDSFDTTFKMKLPPGVHYSKFETFSKDNASNYVYCHALNPPEDVNCNIGNPLQKSQRQNFSIILHPEVTNDLSEFNFAFSVNSTNLQTKTLDDTNVFFSIPIIEDFTFHSETLSFPSKELFYNLSSYENEKIETDEQAGLYLRHTYNIKNLGPSEVSEATVTFYWPSKTRAGDDLLYLTEAPIHSANMECKIESRDNINYRRLKLVRKIKDESERSTGSSQSHYGSSITQTGYTKVYQTGSGGTTTNEINKGQDKNYNYRWQQGSGKNYVGVDVHPQNGMRVGGGQTNERTGGGYRATSDGSYQETRFGGGSGGAYQGGNFVSNGGSYQSGSSSVAGGGSYHGGSSFQGSSGSSSYGHSTYGGGSSSSSSGSFDKSGFQPVKSALPGQGHFDDSGNYIGPTSFKNDVRFDKNGNIIKNYSSVHESENTYTRNTDWGANGAVVKEDRKWYTNDNGVVRNGSFSTVRPIASSHANGGGHFFESETQTGDGVFYGGSSGGGGQVIRKQQLDGYGTNLTTIYEGPVYRGPQKAERGKETNKVYHIKTENDVYLQPSKLPDGSTLYSPPIPLSEIQKQNVAYGKKYVEEKILPYESSQDDATTYEEKYRRSRRSSDDDDEYTPFCTPETCTRVICKVKHLAKEQEISVTFKSLVWIETIKKIGFNRPVQVGSYAEVNITKLPHIKTPKSNHLYKYEILTNITSTDFGKTPPDVIPLWVVVASACLGALILMLLVYLLYRSGFFKRNRPPPLPERQPLNRNGNYHFGDEAL